MTQFLQAVRAQVDTAHMDNAIIARDSVFGFTLQLPGLPPIWYGCELAAARWAAKLGYSVKYNLE